MSQLRGWPIDAVQRRRHRLGEIRPCHILSMSKSGKIGRCVSIIKIARYEGEDVGEVGGELVDG